NATAAMQDAAKEIENNQLSAAQDKQKQSLQALDEVVAALEDRREEHLDRLIKKLKEAEHKLDALIEAQERLREKTRTAGQMTDQAQRAAELKRLAREQQHLQAQTQELV